MTDYIPDTLRKINEDITLLSKYKDDIAIRLLFQHAYDLRKKFLLPDVIEYKKNTTPIGLTDLNFHQIIRKFDIFLRKDLTDQKIMKIFVQMLEGISEEEAVILMAAKNQELYLLYPNITGRSLAKAGYVEAGFLPRLKRKRN